MPDEGQPERRWIVEPPGRGEITLRIAVGEGAELTDEQEAALGTLLQSLEAADAEVVGFDDPGKGCVSFHGSCTEVNCTLTCSVLTCTLTCPSKAKVALSAGGSSSWNLLGSFKPSL